jgi:DNA invertase Pin-like site-specific DNA recombinase
MRVLTASGDDLTNTDDPMNVAMRQIAGAFAQLEKARLVAKLKAARAGRQAQGGA